MHFVHIYGQEPPIYNHYLHFKCDTHLSGVLTSGEFRVFFGACVSLHVTGETTALFIGNDCEAYYRGKKCKMHSTLSEQ